VSTIQNYLYNLLRQSVPNTVVPPQLPSKPFNKIALVGIAPAEDEIQTGQCFTGPSGQVLNKCLDITEIEREACWIGNLIPCRLPDNRPPSRGEVMLFRGQLIDALKEVKPSVILTLGAEPTRAFFPDVDVQIMSMRSHVFTCDDIPGAQIVPSIHPAFVLRRDLAFGALLLNELNIAKDLLNGIGRYRPWSYEEITTIQQLHEILQQHQEDLIFIDTEATSTNPHAAELFMISFAFASDLNKSYVIHCPSKQYIGSMGPEELLDGIGHSTPREDVLAVFSQYNLQVGIFNLLYDYVLLKRNGYTPNVVVDPMYAFTLIDENLPRSLSTLGSFFSGIGPYSMDYTSLNISEWKPYAACDAVNTARVWDNLKIQFENPAKKNLLFKYLIPVLKSLAEMSIVGLGVDFAKLGEVDNRLSKDIQAKLQLMFNAVGYTFNHRSNDQLALVFQKLGIPIIGKTRTGKPSFRKELLSSMADRYPFVQVYQETKHMEKLHSSYVKNIQNYVDDNNRVHANFDIKKTGRLSASDPALQTLPRKSIILELFAAKPGCTLIKCDFSAAELRWMGFLSGQLEWLDPTIDIHVNNASFFFKIPRDKVSDAMRQQVKFIAFGKIYGSSTALLAKQIGISEYEAQQLNDRFFKTFPKVLEFMEKTKIEALEKGYVKNWYGLERHFFFDLRFGEQIDKARIVREAYNFGPQSCCAMWTNLSIIEVQKWCAKYLPEASVVLQIHDAIVVEVPDEYLSKALAAVWQILRRPIDKRIGFFLPVDCSIGPNLLDQEVVIPFYIQDLKDVDKLWNGVGH